jgi:CRP-like cAMP-binding protein
MSSDVGPRANDSALVTVLLLVKSGDDAMAKYNLPVGCLSTDALSEQTLKSALSALQRGPIRFRRNHVIACEGDSADYVFLVVNGVLRSCKTFQNGNRSVVAFYLP